MITIKRTITETALGSFGDIIYWMSEKRLQIKSSKNKEFISRDPVLPTSEETRLMDPKNTHIGGITWRETENIKT
jgi:hypothetical protein